MINENLRIDLTQTLKEALDGHAEPMLTCARIAREIDRFTRHWPEFEEEFREVTLRFEMSGEDATTTVEELDDRLGQLYDLADGLGIRVATS